MELFEHLEKKVENEDCKKCTFTANSTEKLNEHIRDNHVFANFFSFLNTENERKDINVQEISDEKKIRTDISKPKNVKFTCKYCSFSTNYKNHYDDHTRSVHEGIVRNSCSLCDYKAYYKSHVKSHQKLSHPKSECQVLKIAKRKSEEKSSIQRHQDIRHMEKPTRSVKIGCVKCEEGIYHLCQKQRLIGVADNSLKCEDCDFTTNHKQALKNHFQSVHEGVLKFGCNLCSYKSYYKHCVKQHQNNNHTDEEVFKLLRLDCLNCAENIDHLCIAKNKISTKPKKFKCEDCMFSTSDKMYLKDHTRSEHEGVVRNSCSLCDYKSYYKRNVTSHQKSSHPKLDCRVLKIGCPMCESNETHSECENKKKDKSKFYRVKCDQCRFATDYRSVLNIHVKSIHESIVRFSCSLCSYKSYIRQYVDQHQKKRHEGQDCRILSLDCSQCSENVDHECIAQKNFSKKKKTYKCEDCEYSSDYQKKIKQHKNIKHEGVVRFGCNNCDYKHYNKRGITRHQEVNHKESERQILQIGFQEPKTRKKRKKKRKNGYKCQSCSFSGSTSEILYSHAQAAHNEIVKFACNICNAQFNEREEITIHQQSSHVGEKTRILRIGCKSCKDDTEHKTCKLKLYQCNLCTKTFGAMREINSHQYKFHDGEKCKFQRIDCRKCQENEEHVCLKLYRQMSKKKENNVKCTLCEDSFETKALRTIHFKQMHPGKNMFNCSNCVYGSNWFANLRTHQKAKHENTILFCDKCEYSTKWNNAFLAHMRGEHGIFQKETKNNLNWEAKMNHLCDNCGFSARNYIRFKNHQYNCHGIGSKDGKKLNMHQKKVNGNIMTHSCELCDYTATKKEILQTHVLGKHRDTIPLSQWFYCKLCSYKTARKQALNIHMKGKHKETIPKNQWFNCKICEYETTSKECLKIHTQGKHKNTIPLSQWYRCKICDYKIARSTLFKSHCKSHQK